MSARLFTLFLLFCSTIFATDDKEMLRVYIFCSENYAKTKDYAILSHVLENNHCKIKRIEELDFTEIKQKKNDISIFCEKLDPLYLNASRCNWFIPNLATCEEQEKDLQSMDYIVCRTHEEERIFTELGHHVFYTGFKSFNHFDDSIPKNYEACLHISEDNHLHKVTLPLVEVWKNHTNFPLLTIVTSLKGLFPDLSENMSLIEKKTAHKYTRNIQNGYGIHICVNEREGLDHALLEAMSTKSIVMTIDAPPMNEYIEDERCLIPYICWRSENHATHYYVEPAAIEKVVQNLLGLPKSELIEIGEKNRQRFLTLNVSFKENFKKLLSESRNLIKQRN